MSEPTKAVFLSYASQDAGAAKRICDSLRGAGVEVWFDQSEQRWGDAWDVKIRRQIRECALFIPIVSAKTLRPLRYPCSSGPFWRNGLMLAAQSRPTLTSGIRNGPSLVQSNPTRPPPDHRSLLRGSGGRGCDDVEAHEAAPAPRRARALAADEPSEL